MSEKKLEYRFKKGDKVRLARGVRLKNLSIITNGRPPELRGVFEIKDDTPRNTGWNYRAVDGQPTYSVSGGWRILESFLVKV